MAIVLPAAAGVTTVASIVGKVKVIGVGARNTIALMALVVIPADKVNRVTKIIAVCATTASVVLIPLPGAFQRLRITVGIGGTFPGNKAEQLAARWLGARVEGGFLPDCGHQDRYRHAEFLFHLARLLVPVIEPATVLVKDGADILDIGRLRGTP